MVEKTAIGHSKTINEDTEFIVTKQQSSTMVQLYHGTRESSRSLKVYNTKFRVLSPPMLMGSMRNWLLFLLTHRGIFISSSNS